MRQNYQTKSASLFMNKPPAPSYPGLPLEVPLVFNLIHPESGGSHLTKIGEVHDPLNFELFINETLIVSFLYDWITCTWFEGKIKLEKLVLHCQNNHTLTLKVMLQWCWKFNRPIWTRFRYNHRNKFIKKNSPKYCCETNSSHILWTFGQSLRACKIVSTWDSHLKQYGIPPELRDVFNSLVNSYLWAAGQRKVFIHWGFFHFQIINHIPSHSWLFAPSITSHA